MNQLAPQLNLVKGENLNLTKGNPELTLVHFAMGWVGKGDPDASAFLLGADGRLLKTADPKDNTIFYGNPTSHGVTHTGDDRGDDDTKGRGGKDEDRETIIVDISKVHPDVEAVLFVATMYDDDAAQGKISWADSKINFGLVKDLFIRAYDPKTGQEILRFELTEDASRHNAMIFGRLYRHKGNWKFSAMEEPKTGNLNTLRQAYMV